MFEGAIFIEVGGNLVRVVVDLEPGTWGAK